MLFRSKTQTNRRLVATSIVCLLLYQVGAWISQVFGGVWGITSALVVGLVSYACTRLAQSGTGATGWFLVPTLLFTVIPVAARVWSAIAKDTTWAERAIDFGPLLVGFVLPVVLLLLVYTDLLRRPEGQD